jgi:phosphonate transport system ATP-binding protein
MAGGKVVFDGRPADLTRDAVNAIYGATDGLDESMTSTTINIPAQPAPTVPVNRPEPIVLLGV